MDMKREQLTQNFIDEIEPLLCAYGDEMHLFGLSHTDPDWSMYHKLNVAGCLWIFSVRVDGKLIGFNSYIVTPSPHYEDAIYATSDTLYISPEYRGKFAGPRILQYAESQLKKLNICAIQQGVQATNDFSPMLERKGYKLDSYLYVKRIH